jgi:hypothetical protein
VLVHLDYALVMSHVRRNVLIPLPHLELAIQLVQVHLDNQPFAMLVPIVWWSRFLFVATNPMVQLLRHARKAACGRFHGLPIVQSPSQAGSSLTIGMTLLRVGSSQLRFGIFSNLSRDSLFPFVGVFGNQ